MFEDRLQTFKEISHLLVGVFSDGKKRISYDEFVKINENVSSEMFLSIITILQTNLPCATNYFRYKTNYEQAVHGDAPPREKASIKKIASPRLMSKLSPVSQFIAGQGLNVNPVSQQHLLKYAKKGSRRSSGSQRRGSLRRKDSPDSDQDDYSKFQSRRNLEEIKKRRQKELDELRKVGADVVDEASAASIRLPNRVAKGLTIDPNTGTAKQGNDRDVVMSPTAFLRGAASPTMGAFVTEEIDDVQCEGEMVRKATETKLKKYWYSLLGNELYVYKTKNDEKHKGMHNLSGVFIKDDAEEYLDSTTVLHPFTLVFPGNKPRTYYLLNREDKAKWMTAIKRAIGYSNLFDFYEVKETLGKGKFGLVKSAVHKKTGKRVAVKVMSKKEMSIQDVELQRREIEILKMCQHPNIIRLLDIFENQDYIYIVMEALSGGDLFTYLEKRNFTVSERRAKELAHQMATAIYYLHSFGVAHRDLKPENILMDSDGETADLKIVDFGLSKIIGPNESSLDPFGTLSYVAPEVLLQKPYGKEVDLWSLGVIVYLLLCRVLPFDDEDDKEIARQTIQDPPDFSFEPWNKVSGAARDLVKGLLEKNRQKRLCLEDVLQHKWFSDYKAIFVERADSLRNKNGIDSRFEAFTVTDPAKKIEK